MWGRWSPNSAGILTHSRSQTEPLHSMKAKRLNGVTSHRGPVNSPGYGRSPFVGQPVSRHKASRVELPELLTLVNRLKYFRVGAAHVIPVGVGHFVEFECAQEGLMTEQSLGVLKLQHQAVVPLE